MKIPFYLFHQSQNLNNQKSVSDVFIQMIFLYQNAALLFICGRRWEVHLPFLQDYFNHVVLHQISNQHFLQVFSNHLIPDTSYLDTTSCISSVKIARKKKSTCKPRFSIIYYPWKGKHIYILAHIYFFFQ